MEMTERKKKILAAVVERYILSGEPVGSKALVDLPGLSVSSATVRNDMADLVTAGYLEQPHTSAGRIPSSEGYRYYVDNLMGRYELSDKRKNALLTQSLRAFRPRQRAYSEKPDLFYRSLRAALPFPQRLPTVRRLYAASSLSP